MDVPSHKCVCVCVFVSISNMKSLSWLPSNMWIVYRDTHSIFHTSCSSCSVEWVLLSQPAWSAVYLGGAGEVRGHFQNPGLQPLAEPQNILHDFN